MKNKNALWLFQVPSATKLNAATTLLFAPAYTAGTQLALQPHLTAALPCTAVYGSVSNLIPLHACLLQVKFALEAFAVGTKSGCAREGARDEKCTPFGSAVIRWNCREQIALHPTPQKNASAG